MAKHDINTPHLKKPKTKSKKQKKPKIEREVHANKWQYLVGIFVPFFGFGIVVFVGTVKMKRLGGKILEFIYVLISMGVMAVIGVPSVRAIVFFASYIVSPVLSLILWMVFAYVLFAILAIICVFIQNKIIIKKNETKKIQAKQMDDENINIES